MSIAVVMGVSGCGKTTIARLVGARLGWAVIEGDAFHPPANIEKMRHGSPLDDADRWPWLTAIAGAIDAERAADRSALVACSALKRAYRAILIGERADVALVYLQGSRAVIAARLAARRGHFMPPGLLDSQFAALEEPGADEHPITVAIDQPAEAVAAAILDALASRRTLP